MQLEDDGIMHDSDFIALDEEVSGQHPLTRVTHSSDCRLRLGRGFAFLSRCSCASILQSRFSEGRIQCVILNIG